MVFQESCLCMDANWMCLHPKADKSLAAEEFNHIINQLQIAIH